MLRIIVKENDDGSEVRLSGRLAGEYVAEAKQVCFSAAEPLLIDATELQDADADGFALLAKLIDGGARVEGLSGYLAMRVDALRRRSRS
ncbi:MAG: hypothetical protein JSW71_07170 [Gemmatimonadota bacterium]|nr:MAG: hypothetical protein JSW71_07170 [Gemmatimonadota bacterium]